MLLQLHKYSLSVCRLDPGAPFPFWATRGTFFSVHRTADELSIVCEEKLVPPNVKAEDGWRCIKVQGPLDFGLTGVLASLANPLADARISIFALSTFDTDYILMKEERLAEAKKVLREAGHTFV